MFRNLPVVDEKRVAVVVFVPDGGRLGRQTVNIECDGIEYRKIAFFVAFTPVFGYGNVCVSARGGFVLICGWNCQLLIDHGGNADGNASTDKNGLKIPVVLARNLS